MKINTQSQGQVTIDTHFDKKNNKDILYSKIGYMNISEGHFNKEKTFEQVLDELDQKKKAMVGQGGKKEFFMKALQSK